MGRGPVPGQRIRKKKEEESRRWDSRSLSFVCFFFRTSRDGKRNGRRDSPELRNRRGAALRLWKHSVVFV